MKGFSADLTFELELKIFELAPKIATAARTQNFVHFFEDQGTTYQYFSIF